MSGAAMPIDPLLRLANMGSLNGGSRGGGAGFMALIRLLAMALGLNLLVLLLVAAMTEGGLG